MNLYRSFGNLMEAWVTEDAQCSCSELLGSRDEPSPSPSTNLRSESVDSGVEMASSDMSFHATCSSVSTDTTESDGFAADREASTRAPASSVLSGPSPSGPFSPCLPETQDRSSILQQKVEAALQRSNSKHLMDKPAVEVRRRDSRAQQRPASELLRGQRSDRFDLRRTFNPSEPMRLTRHHRSSVASDRLAFQRRLEDLSEGEANGLSPGFCYLEHVCQMLEEFAEQQRHNQALQRQKTGLQTRPAGEASAGSCLSAFQPFDSCQTDSGAAATSAQRQESKREERSTGERRRPRNLHGHFRQRSASDANVSTLHLRVKDTACRGQHLSADDLLMELNEDQGKQGSDGEKRSDIRRSWKSKIRSLTRNLSVMRDVKSQQMQATEEKRTRPGLSQLFWRNKKKAVSA